MKNLILLFIAFLLIQFTSFAQEGWFWQNPLPQGNNLNDVHIFDDNSAIAIGNTGTIININSNGQIELVRHNVNGKYSKFNCMFFINNDNGWIGGDGFILKTEDGGANWRETNSSELQYNTIFFIDDSTGWIAGEIWGWGFAFGIMLKTTDAGENWTPTSENKLCNDFHFINSETGWAIFGYYHWEYGTDYSVWKTSDGGDNWNEISEEYFTTIYFINDTLGWAGSQIKKTTDGGITWQTAIDTTYFCKEIFFEDEENGWALMEADSIIYTDDGGNTWQGQNINSQDIFELNSFSINNNGFGVGVGNAGHIRTKQPLSAIWEPITQSVHNQDISAIYVLDENNLWVCGGENRQVDTIPGKAVILHSLDGGNTWDKKVFYDSNPFQYNNSLSDIYFLDDNYGWAVGTTNIILNTTDGGNTWIFQNSGLSYTYDIFFEKVLFTDSLHGFIMGGGYILLHTQDGGETWYDSRSNLPTSFGIRDIFFYDSNNGWIVGHNGYDGAGEIYRTNDGGQTWQIIKRTYDDWTYKSVQFLDSLVGWVAGDDFNSEVLFTENGGNDWEIIFTYPYPITDFYFLDNNYGWVIVSNLYQTDYQYISDYQPTYLYYTNNGGLSWGEYLTIPSPNINAIAFANQNTGWVVGGDGAILKTNSGGITAIDNQTNEILSIPNNFQLFQNYPNPFNPSTTISYSLPSSSLVQLKIFNILGQEVATLVNEEKMSGNYKVDFNASNLPSGIYFYRLQAGSFVETKKMVLMK